ncbi:MAG: TIGR04282 family arsenosugar biosynthesis glycosyltransferase [Pseudomonadota bacterium]
MADLILQQFARSPVPGRVKTRLQPALGPEQACDVHRDLVTWTADQLLASGLGVVELWVAGEADDPLFQMLLARGVAALRIQEGEDLGARMCAALRDGCGRASGALLVGSDCPGIDAAYLAMAAASIKGADLVLGPAEDGGFVLIGGRKAPPPALFDDTIWGSSSVLDSTLKRAAQLGLDVSLLPCLRDIDRLEDLDFWFELVSTQRAGNDPPAGGACGGASQAGQGRAEP